MNDNIKQKGLILTAVAILFGSPFGAAHAQGLNNRAWSPQASNRASIAALMRQVEDRNSSRQATTSAIVDNGVTQLICGSNSGEGKEASSSAQANSSCIILNNSDGGLNIDQDSDGEQTSDAQSQSTMGVDETNTGQTEENIDDVLATLSGE